MSQLQKSPFIKQLGLSKHFNVGSGWLPSMSLGMPGIVFFEAFEERWDIVIDSGEAERPLRDHWKYSVKVLRFYSQDFH